MVLKVDTPPITPNVIQHFFFFQVDLEFLGEMLNKNTLINFLLFKLHIGDMFLSELQINACWNIGACETCTSKVEVCQGLGC
jgi:hypothetical protein